ncbi:MAG TPA: (Fe-S)-binding protein [Gemmatimonadaceae bacterium]|nr:(Fe-S)-binding protein [Gemmatimonadaceae bacterium]
MTAVAILGGVGLVFALLIAFANKKLRVWEDPRIDVVAGMLPGANCGACGVPGCRAFAEKLVTGETKPAGCNVANDGARGEIAQYLGVDAGSATKVVARLMCAGGAHVASQQVRYQGYGTCAAAAVVAAGGKGCTWGCLGLADCVRACTFDAMAMNEDGLPVVDLAKCTACGDCVDACPKNLLELHPVDRRLLVQCKNLIVGDDIVADCAVACTACGKCVMDAAPGLISVASGVARIDYEKNDLADIRAISRCPTGAIVWLNGAQFQPAAPSGVASDDRRGARVAPQLIGSAP